MKNNIKHQIEYWQQNAEHKWLTAMSLMKMKRYADALFFCHLTLESLLKALVIIKTNSKAPLIHNLNRLTELAEFNLSDKQKQLLKIANTFNLRARYDDYKFTFYKRATKDYAEKYFKECNNLRLWLLKKLPNNKQKSS